MALDPTNTVALLGCIAIAFVVEAALGFGATLVAVSLGALFLPLDRLLPAFVPVNLLLSAVLVARNRRHVDLRLFLRRVLPAMAAGLPLGMWAFRALPERVLVAVYGGFVIVLSALELFRMGRSGPGGAPPPAPVGTGLLFCGGVVHGAFGTGGPMAVYVLGRELSDKARFRATLSLLWLTLNAVLVAGFVVDGTLDAARAIDAALLLPPLVFGLVVGEALHRRVPAGAFRIVVFAMLLVAGAALVTRA